MSGYLVVSFRVYFQDLPVGGGVSAAIPSLQARWRHPVLRYSHPPDRDEYPIWHHRGLRAPHTYPNQNNGRKLPHTNSNAWHPNFQFFPGSDWLLPEDHWSWITSQQAKILCKLNKSSTHITIIPELGIVCYKPAAYLDIEAQAERIHLITFHHSI